MTSGMTKSTKWLHHDDELAPTSGITYELRYIGSMPVRVSIKAVDLETRTRIAHASIHQVCEDVGRKPPRNTRLNKSLEPYLGLESDKNWAMTNVYLTITTQALTVETIDLNWPIFRHNLSMVSFASGGDAETLDFICYVAKNDQEQRMCYVFESPAGLAQDVIMTLGQAFKLGYQDFKKGKSCPTTMDTDPGSTTKTNKANTNNQHHQHYHQNNTNNTVVDQSKSTCPSPLALGAAETRLALPAPDPVTKPNGHERSSSRSQPQPFQPMPSSSDAVQASGLETKNPKQEPVPPALPPTSSYGSQCSTFDHFADFDENACLLENDASNADVLDPSVSSNNHDRSGQNQSQSTVTTRGFSSSTVSGINTTSTTGKNGTTTTTTTANTASSIGSHDRTAPSKTSTFDRLEPVGEPWYVGKMSRSQAESLLRYEGDFLVRASPHQPGQFVLSGMQDSKCRHLLLADPNGLVRTKERVFDSIQHLIDYHVQNGVPIRSTDSEIRLIFPVSTVTFCEL